MLLQLLSRAFFSVQVMNLKLVRSQCEKSAPISETLFSEPPVRSTQAKSSPSPLPAVWTVASGGVTCVITNEKLNPQYTQKTGSVLLGCTMTQKPLATSCIVEVKLVGRF